MSKTLVRLLVVLTVLTLVSLVPVRATEASILKIDFTGTYDTSGDVIFGQNGSSLPFAYSITYDTSLAPAPVFVPAGTLELPGIALVEDFYGYSKAGITASSLTFGTQTFTVSNLQSRSVGGSTADLWFNTNLETATPTKTYAAFRSGGNALALGGVVVTIGAAAFDTTSMLDAIRGHAFGDLTLTVTPVSQPVPEPASILLLGSGLLALAARVRHNSSQR